jgi:vitamin-K-epoxide reductase (warfarin-sensitive)
VQVFHSPQGKIFSYFGVIPKGSVLDQPNALYGCLFYTAIIFTTLPLLPLQIRKYLLLAGTTFGILLSAYLAYVLAFVLGDFCIICVSSYVFNTTAFTIAVINTTSDDSTKKKQ